MRVLILCFALVLSLQPALAQECAPTTSSTALDTRDAAQERYYVALDDCSWWCVSYYQVWIYEESNGIEGLQRGDEVVDDTCGGRIASDSIVY